MLRLLPRTKRKLLSNQLIDCRHQATTNKDYYITNDDLDLQTGYPDPRVVDPDEMDDIELSDEVIVRLWVARMKAVQRHRELYA